MKIAYLIFLIGYLIASSSNDKIIDITYDELNEVDVSKYPENYIPSNTEFYYRAKIDPNSLMQIEIRVLKGSITNFRVYICAFKDRPSDMELLAGNDNCERIFLKAEVSDIFETYLSDFDIAEGVNYLGIHMISLSPLDYLSFNLLKYRIINNPIIKQEKYYKELV